MEGVDFAVPEGFCLLHKRDGTFTWFGKLPARFRLPAAVKEATPLFGDLRLGVTSGKEVCITLASSPQGLWGPKELRISVRLQPGD